MNIFAWEGVFLPMGKFKEALVQVFAVVSLIKEGLYGVLNDSGVCLHGGNAFLFFAARS